MSTDQDPATEWLAQGDAVTSGALNDRIANEPDVKQVQRIAPDTVVLSMRPAMAARLRTAFPQRLVLEPNKDLPLP